MAQMRTHLDPLDPNQSSLRPAIQRISQLSISLNHTDDLQTDSLAEQIRGTLQLPERIRQLVRDGQREQAQLELEQLKILLTNWKKVKDIQELLNQCKAALAFGE
jgi:hypothetical protein